jgi:peptidoglycan/xylan/chitin deacetylase (PgdA/CDA1 family)
VYKSSRCHRAPLAALLLFSCVHSGSRGRPPASRKDRVDTTPVACQGAADAGGFELERIATWRDDAAGAYAIVHDDLCSPELRGIDRIAAPALEARGLTATMGAIVRSCEEYQLWGMVRDLEGRGHEIGNHSFNHVVIRPHNAALEVTEAKRVLDAHVAHPVSFFLFPYDDFARQTIELVESAGHSVVRAGPRDDNDGLTNPPINDSDPDNDLRLEFDAWPRAFSKYALYPEKDILNVHAWNAIERRGFAVRELHSVTPRSPAPPTGEGFFPVPLPIYEAHLDFLVDAWKANQLWTSSVSTIVRYRHARETCKVSLSGSSLRFDASDPDCRRHATPLSVVVRTGRDVPGLAALQAGKPVFTRKLGPARFSVTAEPTGAAIDLAGCATPSLGVDRRVILPRKPPPASSVCVLEGVRASGRAGRMDDLERAPDQLQLLPNPAQRDGRNGTWSWYPPGTLNATILEERDVAGGKRNRVLRYAGSGLQASAGVALAFLGGSGAGSCYDASAYQGLRFKIRGTTASDDPAARDKVVISLVTAETQSLRYGGDLRGGGGHFHREVPLSPQWREVRLAWDQFQPPTWGDTAHLRRLALDKLQAIDWGVSRAVTSFEIDLDDVELY